MEPPPPYESIMMTSFPRSDSNDSNATGTIQQVQAVMAMPPKYSDISGPIPPYGESI